jgi:hypothetical protein
MGLTCCLLTVAALVACHRFPADFGSLSLDGKIAAYERWIAQTGKPRGEAQSWISWHGVPAADAMVPYLLGQKAGIPKSEALYIVWAIQLRGCSLQGTPVPDALNAYLKTSPSPPGVDLDRAQAILEDIRLDRHVTGFDTLPAGPCNK